VQGHRHDLVLGKWEAVTQSKRYQLAYPSYAIHAKLEAKAKKNGTWSETCDDWFEPQEIEDYIEVEGVQIGRAHV